MKQAIIINSDLKMSKGKIASQAAHAAVLSVLEDPNSVEIRKWCYTGMTKVVLRATEKELNNLMELAAKNQIAYSFVEDAGHTQVEQGALTAIAIGPDEDEVIDEIIMGLKLL